MGKLDRFYWPDGYRPARSSGVHCSRCGIVFAEPAPPLDVSGERICNECANKPYVKPINHLF